MAARAVVVVLCAATGVACLASAGAAQPAKQPNAKGKQAKVEKRCTKGKTRQACVRRRTATFKTKPDTALTADDLADAPSPGIPPDPPPGGPEPVEEEPPLGRSVQVRAREFSLTLSRSVVAAGDVNVEFNTVVAEDPHDLWLRAASGDERELFDETEPELVPPPRQRFAFTAGDYVLFCSLSGHEALGMSAPLEVR